MFTIISTDSGFNPMAVACHSLLMAEELPCNWITDPARAYSLAGGKLRPGGFVIEVNGRILKSVYDLVSYIQEHALMRI